MKYVRQRILCFEYNLMDILKVVRSFLILINVVTINFELL